MKIIPLSEGAFTIDKTKVFIPFNVSVDDLQKRPAGSLLVEVQPFAVVTSKDVLVIDTGLGFSTKGELQLHHNLNANGIEPSCVTKVLMSHLHKDHAGGIKMKDEFGNDQLSFPGAQYYVQKQELDYAFNAGTSSYLIEELEVLKDNPAVQILDGSGVIDDYIYYEISGGHSPYHQVFRIEEDGQTIFFGGDVAPQLQQMKSRFVAKYDFDGKKSMELRRLWWEIGQQQEWAFLFYHDIKNPVWPVQ
jgi:glyoxylase-like metal-dependent hydrolase (beta-lactamase superfamily II)